MPSIVLATLTQAGTGQRCVALLGVEIRVGVRMERQLQPCMVTGEEVMAGPGREKAKQGRLRTGGGI